MKSIDPVVRSLRHLEEIISSPAHQQWEEKNKEFKAIYGESLNEMSPELNTVFRKIEGSN